MMDERKKNYFEKRKKYKCFDGTGPACLNIVII
jgi:hypothetical protein